LKLSLSQPWFQHYPALNIFEPEFDDKTLSDYIDQHAVTMGDKVALRYFERAVNYAEYNQRADALTELGLVRGDLVGIHLPNIPQCAIVDTFLTATTMSSLHQSLCVSH